MKVAFSVWNDNISPVFDVSKTIRLVEVEEGKITAEQDRPFSFTTPFEKARFLHDCGIQEVVCGAISRFMYCLIESFGIKVIPFTSGRYDHVRDAWLQGGLDNAIYAMPGCGTNRVNRCRRFQHWCGQGGVEEELPYKGDAMSSEDQNGGKGVGKGAGRGRCGKDKKGYGMGSGGNCICSQCGYKKPHERGIPCQSQMCPKCNIPLIRE